MSARYDLRAGDPRVGPTCPECGGPKYRFARMCKDCCVKPGQVRRSSRLPKDITDWPQSPYGEGATSTNAVLAMNVRKLRLMAGLSVNALETRCGITRTTLWSIEYGKGTNTGIVGRIADALGVQVWWLFEPYGYKYKVGQ